MPETSSTPPEPSSTPLETSSPSWRWGAAPPAEPVARFARTGEAILAALAERERRPGETLAGAMARVQARLLAEPAPGQYRAGWWKCYVGDPETWRG
jgi:hypothetical protein